MRTGSPPKSALLTLMEHDCLPRQAASTTAWLVGALQLPVDMAGHVPEGLPKLAKRILSMVAPASAHCSASCWPSSCVPQKGFCVTCGLSKPMSL